MKKNVWKKALIFMTIIVFLLIGLKFDGNLSHLLEQRADFMNNVQMGGSRYSLSLASLKYYVSYITEPFAFRNILETQDCLRVFPSAPAAHFRIKNS